MKAKKQHKGSIVGVYEKGDLRSENRELAFKLFFRELHVLALDEQSVPNDKIQRLLDRWNIKETELGTRSSINIDFPKGLKRNQWFYEDGEAVPREVTGS